MNIIDANIGSAKDNMSTPVLIRKNYFNEVMRQVMSDFNKLLEYDD